MMLMIEMHDVWKFKFWDVTTQDSLVGSFVT
jgi:hypothetical protein